MLKNDRMIAGAISGMLASVIQEIYANTTTVLGFSNRDFGDYAGVLVMSQNYQGLLAHVIQLLAHISVGALFGIIFAALFRYATSNYWWLKGIIYGSVLWVLLTGIGTLFKMPMWINIPPRAALDLYLGSVVFGFSTAYILKYLDEKTELI